MREARPSRREPSEVSISQRLGLPPRTPALAIADGAIQQLLARLWHQVVRTALWALPGLTASALLAEKAAEKGTSLGGESVAVGAPRMLLDPPSPPQPPPSQPTPRFQPPHPAPHAAPHAAPAAAPPPAAEAEAEGAAAEAAAGAALSGGLPPGLPPGLPRGLPRGLPPTGLPLGLPPADSGGHQDGHQALPSALLSSEVISSLGSALGRRQDPPLPAGGGAAAARTGRLAAGRGLQPARSLELESGGGSGGGPALSWSQGPPRPPQCYYNPTDRCLHRRSSSSSSSSSSNSNSMTRWQQVSRSNWQRREVPDRSAGCPQLLARAPRFRRFLRIDDARRFLVVLVRRRELLKGSRTL